MIKKVFGLSGGIGTGKSTLAKILQENYADVEIFDSDKIAKKIVEEGEVKNELKKIWGNKKEIIFENKKKKIAVEELIHPKVWEELDKLIKKVKNKKIILVESAILFDVGKDKEMLKNIVTDCSLTERKKRLKKRNNWNDKEIDLRIKNQMNQSLMKRKADIVINTECSLKELKNKAEDLHQYLLKF